MQLQHTLLQRGRARAGSKPSRIYSHKLRRYTALQRPARSINHRRAVLGDLSKEIEQKIHRRGASPAPARLLRPRARVAPARSDVLQPATDHRLYLQLAAV